MASYRVILNLIGGNKPTIDNEHETVFKFQHKEDLYAEITINHRKKTVTTVWRNFIGTVIVEDIETLGDKAYTALMASLGLMEVIVVRQQKRIYGSKTK